MPSGIIAGTAIYSLEGLDLIKTLIETEYGEAVLYQTQVGDQELYFLPRHGVDHSVPPHRINYRANLRALHSLGVKAVLAAYAVGSIHQEIPPLSVVVLDDLIDFTSGRKSTFYDGGASGVEHVDMSVPFHSGLRETLLETAGDFSLKVRDGGVYIAVDGPRLETPAEINMFRQWGADVVGMTASPECALARELDLDYAAAAFSVNWAAGKDQQVQIVEEGLDATTDQLMQWFIQTLQVYVGQQPG
jgi:5'-methylthioadenosine phosphorylase